MLSDSAIYLVLLFAVANLALIGWVLRAVKSASAGPCGIAIDGRFDAIERNNEVLRRALNEMDQGLRGEIASGAPRQRPGRQTVVPPWYETRRLRSCGRVKPPTVRSRPSVTSANACSRPNKLSVIWPIASGPVSTDFSERLREEAGATPRQGRRPNLRSCASATRAKLEQMRKAVDEQLQSALEKGLGESFQRVAEQFAQVQQAIGQVQSVAGQIGDLKRLFSNVKARGGVDRRSPTDLAR